MSTPMSWKESSKKQEKLIFIADWLKDEFSFAELCRRYSISRKTGYKLINRYQAEGEEAFKELSRARHHYKNKTAEDITKQLINVKYRYPDWGPMKIKAWLEENNPGKYWPAVSTIGDILKRHNLVMPRKYRRTTPGMSIPLGEPKEPNDIWSADFKGQFRLGNNEYCYPLTITDNASRYLFCCHGMDRPELKGTKKCFERIFAEYGLPDAIRTDNGQPFAGTGIGGLSQLSIWWIKLGILPERIQKGHPEQN